MKTFLFIHGGAHGAWCWGLVIDELERLGHKAYAIDMPGSGADQAPRETVNVRMCIDRIIEWIDAENLSDVILVGHSLAGVYMPTVAQERSKKIQEVIFVAGAVLSKGERLFDFIPEDRQVLYEELVSQSSDNSLSWSFEVTKRVFFADVDNPEAAHAKLTPQALNPYLEVADTSPVCPQKTRYILCRDDTALLPRTCEDFAQKLGVTPEYIDSGHDVMLSRPDELVRVLSGA